MLGHLSQPTSQGDPYPKQHTGCQAALAGCEKVSLERKKKRGGKINPETGIDEDAREKEQVMKGRGGTSPAPGRGVTSKRDMLTN